MGRKTPPFKEYPKWTTARYWSFVRSALRKAFTRWPPKYECLNDAKRTVTGKRHRYEYKCAKCSKWYKQKDVQVDHIKPCGSLNKHEDLPRFVRRLFVAKDKLRVLCKPCHQGETNEQRDKRVPEE